MSLLPSVPSGSPLQPYYMENCGTSTLPVIKGDSTGKILVGSQANGLVLRGTPSNGAAFIRGGKAADGSLTLGSDGTSFNNIVLTEDTVTINSASVVMAAGDFVVNGDATVTGGLTVEDGITISAGGLVVQDGADVVLSGGSISGYFSATTASASYPDGDDTAIANPAGISEGWYIIAAACAVGSQAEEQVSTIAHWSGTLWDIGGACQSTAGAGSFGFKPTDDRTQMRVHNSTGAAQIATIQWAKLLN